MRRAAGREVGAWETGMGEMMISIMIIMMKTIKDGHDLNVTSHDHHQIINHDNHEIIMIIMIMIKIMITMIIMIIMIWITGKGGRNLDQEIVEAAVSSRSPAVLRLILMRCFVIIIIVIIVFCNCQQLS